MTTLATHPVPNPDELALFADSWTPVTKPFADRFYDACRAEAEAHDGWVDPNGVRRRLMVDGPIENPRQLSALWSASCSRTGFMVKTKVTVPIVGEGSKGNTNKSVPLRRWAA